MLNVVNAHAWGTRRALCVAVDDKHDLNPLDWLGLQLTVRLSGAGGKHGGDEFGIHI